MLHGHGGAVYLLAQKYGLSPQEITDHSSNVSPLPPPAGLYDLLGKYLDQIEVLPEVDSASLREALADQLGLEPEQILPSSGTTEWIFALPRLLRPQKVLILGPTYADYADAAKAVGAQIDYFLAKVQELFAVDLKALLRDIPGHEMVFICNPNNPTGMYIPWVDLLKVIRRFPEIVFVVDESYLDFILDISGSLATQRPFPENLVVLRSFSKIYRIPGLRLGYAVAGPRLASLLWREYLPWSVNRLAQLAGPWLLRQKEHVKKVQSLVKQERERVIPRLEGLPGLKVFPSAVHFFLLRFSSPAREIWEGLLKRYKILTRLAENFTGLDTHYLRVALRTPKENDRLLAALEDLCK